MKNIIVTSIRKDAGKTSVIVGLAKNSTQKMGYLKPFGDRLLYRKKRLWDFDAAVCTAAMQADESPEEMSIGFDHSKLRFMYDETTTAQKVREIAAHNSKGKEIMLIESGKELTRGLSVHLDAISLCKYLDGELLVVLSGTNDQIVDDACALKKTIDLGDVKLAGVIINKVHDVEDFKAVYSEYFEALELPVLGIIPYAEELTKPSMRFLADLFFAKILAGEKGLKNTIKDVFVGAMSADAVLRMQRFNKESKLVITSGDRSDMILAALDSQAAGIILTNNILPPPNILARASGTNVPLLLVAQDTFQAAKKVDNLVSLLSKDDDEKMALLADMIKDHVEVMSIS
ncbi:MAG: AAA family ATPase [Candidatus Marinimicrobia bacterium]|jgi:BioD-like phosphotransacetylase family protein|nr:AAA family ATPase [Candidatus Neomarinimicrobiota bacterium]MBT4362574.1 AAA family ATPase [Candidatus Neomarinimicrobiota bacterium]MBT4716047.1 AAA family ATPase [Candidatus Neomarinimicrobiota bacterium]MBT4947471.1 AAA family ATPase [Candidatus Neomarinimicrobiota bacterium]MBT5271538.1 AAA family ATPase [Candidatus Neomarinimicrobiota bacterium]